MLFELSKTRSLVVHTTFAKQKIQGEMHKNGPLSALFLVYNHLVFRRHFKHVMEKSCYRLKTERPIIDMHVGDEKFCKTRPIIWFQKFGQTSLWLEFIQMEYYFATYYLSTHLLLEKFFAKHKKYMYLQTGIFFRT